MDIQHDHILHSRDGKFENDTSQPADVTRILGTALSANHQNGLAIHFHGGLVGQKSARGIADFLAPEYAKADTYPLFFVWESGPIETLKNNLSDILADPAFRELVKKASEWALKKLGGQTGLKGGPGQSVNEVQLRKDFDRWFDGVSANPPLRDSGSHASAGIKGSTGLNEDDLADDIEAGLDDDPDFQAAIEQLHNAVAAATTSTKGAGTQAAATVALVDERACRELFPDSGTGTKGGLSWIDVARFVAKIVIRVATRYAQERAHGMYCTVVEEVLRSAYLQKVGAVVWNQMKKDTLDSFGSDPRCCGTTVLKELGRLHAEGKSFARITLIGHSTGAVYICEWLDAAAIHAPDLQFNIIFLAPAVRHERFAAALGKHRKRIGGFRMFGMSDPVESEDVLLPIVYTRSLLYFISGVLEGHIENGEWQDDVDAPIVGMQRYITNTDIFNADSFPAVAQVRQFLQQVPEAMVWSDSLAGNGCSSRSHKHGDFDNDPDTISSLIWMLGH